MSYDSIVLASRSPRRSQLLRQIGIPHEVLCVDFDEERLPGEAPRGYVERLARDKALHARRQHPELGGRLLLTADTAVVLVRRSSASHGTNRTASACWVTCRGVSTR